jgi:hypothetical protein
MTRGGGRDLMSFSPALVADDLLGRASEDVGGRDPRDEREDDEREEDLPAQREVADSGEGGLHAVDVSLAAMLLLILLSSGNAAVARAGVRQRCSGQTRSCPASGIRLVSTVRRPFLRARASARAIGVVGGGAARRSSRLGRLGAVSCGRLGILQFPVEGYGSPDMAHRVRLIPRTRRPACPGNASGWRIDSRDFTRLQALLAGVALPCETGVARRTLERTVLRGSRG